MCVCVCAYQRKYNLIFCVTYWTSTQPSIRKQVHLVENINIYNLDRGWVEFAAIATLTGSRPTLNNYINRCHRRVELVGVRVSWSPICSSRQWEPSPNRGLGNSGTPLEQPVEWERSAAKDRGTWGQYVAVFSVSNSPLTHKPFATLSQPFRISVYMYTYSCITAIQHIHICSKKRPKRESVR